MYKKKQIISVSAALLLAACSSTSQDDNYRHSGLETQCLPTLMPEISEMSVSGITLVGTHVAKAEFDTSAAEIVSYDSCTDKLYVVNAQESQVDVLALDEVGRPINNGAIDLTGAGIHSGVSIGAANSVSANRGLVAVAIENENKQENGIIALYRSDTLELITTYPAGPLPDMVSFSKDGRYLAAANEGEPSKDYSVDPEGSVTLIDLKEGPLKAEVVQIGFGEFNLSDVRGTELSDKVRISGPGASVAQDLEPEYLTFSDNGMLYVALQENNAIASINISEARVEEIWGLGGKPWEDAQLDASNKDKIVGNFRSYEGLQGLYMPDSITSFSLNGKVFILTANEGDGREYGIDTTQKICDQKGFKWDEDDFTGTGKYDTEEGFCIAYTDETRGAKLDIETNHNLAAALKDKKQLGRLKVIKDKKVLAGQPVYAFGARSFSIFDEDGSLVYDSGDEFGQIAFHSNGKHFNSTNDNNDSGDDRSDDKGTEPEAIETANINGRQYAFIGLERQGGIMVYDVTYPDQPMFIHYSNNRNYQEAVCTETDDGDCANGIYNPAAGDLGPESIEYFSRNGMHYLAVGNEVSGTTSVYKIDF